MRRAREIDLEASIARGYEREEHTWRSLIVFALGIALLTAAGLYTSFYVMSAFRTQLTRERPLGYLSAGGTAFRPKAPRPVPPEEELSVLRGNEEYILNSYGWVSRENGQVRVPIERAMELVVRDFQNGGREKSMQPGASE